MELVISESCYKGTSLQMDYWKMTIPHVISNIKAVGLEISDKIFSCVFFSIKHMTTEVHI